MKKIKASRMASKNAAIGNLTKRETLTVPKMRNRLVSLSEKSENLKMSPNEIATSQEVEGKLINLRKAAQNLATTSKRSTLHPEALAEHEKASSELYQTIFSKADADLSPKISALPYQEYNELEYSPADVYQATGGRMSNQIIGIFTSPRGNWY